MKNYRGYLICFLVLTIFLLFDLPTWSLLIPLAGFISVFLRYLVTNK